MRLKLKSQSVTLKTKDKYLTEDIELLVDDSLINNQDDRLKKLLDATKSAYYLFDKYAGTSINDLINYDDTSQVTNMNYMVNYCENLKSIPLLDTHSATSMNNTFYYCSNLETIPQLDTSNVIEMSYTFAGCKKLKSIYLSDTSKVTKMNNMCYGCYELETISPLNTINVTNFSSAFRDCRKLKKLDISHYNISSTSNSSQMFDTSYELQALIIRSFGDNYVMNSNAFVSAYRLLHKKDSTYNSNNLYDGYIYVPRAMIETLQSATNWSSMYFRALEDYTLDGTCEGEFDDEKAGL